MKKISIILIGSLVATIALYGCGSSKAAINTTNVGTTASNNVQTSSSNTTKQNTEVATPENKTIESTTNFNFTKATYVNKNVKIEYPQITDFNDSKKQTQINDIIKNDILNDYKNRVTSISEYYYNKDYQKAEADLTENVVYNIKLNSTKLLSILYTENGSLPNSAHPNTTLHSININIDNGTVLTLKDLININYSFVEKIKSGKDKLWTAKSLYDPEQNTSLADELLQFLKTGNDKLIIDQFSKNDYSFYFTKDSLGMSYSISHAAGDYGTFEIKYNDLKDYIKSDNPIWKNLITQLPTNISKDQSSSGNLKDISGFTPIENQSFMVTLNSWGEVKFVSGKVKNDEISTLAFYLTNKNGDILYDFNGIYDISFPYNSEIKAISFDDVNKDGLKDIIVITNKGNNNSAIIYFQKDGNIFTTDSKLNQQINDSGNNKDIKTVKDYLSKKF